MNLHAIAARRGDGLRPELADALNRWQARRAAGPNLVELSAYRGEEFVQAGPHPTPPPHKELPNDVIRFPGEKRNGTATHKHAARRGKEA